MVKDRCSLGRSRTGKSTSELKAGLAQAFLRLVAVRRVHQALAEELDVEERVEAAHLLGFAPRAFGVAELRERAACTARRTRCGCSAPPRRRPALLRGSGRRGKPSARLNIPSAGRRGS